ncbi:MAG: hypothetical protein JWR69_4255 [Pedosphaera sp.]|nr:hypothetical protein [Pedosphaera sp.]
MTGLVPVLYVTRPGFRFGLASILDEQVIYLAL